MGHSDQLGVTANDLHRSSVLVFQQKSQLMISEATDFVDFVDSFNPCWLAGFLVPEILQTPNESVAVLIEGLFNQQLVSCAFIPIISLAHSLLSTTTCYITPVSADEPCVNEVSSLP